MKRIWVVLFLLMSGCGFGNLDYIKTNAPEVFRENGYKIIGYQGYELSPVIPFTKYGGANVWYIVEKLNDNKVTYTCALKRWGNEIHIYNLNAIDAIKPN